MAKVNSDLRLLKAQRNSHSLTTQINKLLEQLESESEVDKCTIVSDRAFLRRPRICCKYTRCNGSHQKYFRFPRDSQSLTIWRNLCNIPQTVSCLNFYLCADHFDENDVNPSGRLKFNTIPKPPKFLLPTATKPVSYTPCRKKIGILTDDVNKVPVGVKEEIAVCLKSNVNCTDPLCLVCDNNLGI